MKYITLYLFTLIIFSLSSCSKEEDISPNENTETPKGSILHDKTFAGVPGNGSTAVLQSDGKLIVAGQFGTTSNYAYNIYRLNKNGSIDNSFDIDIDKSWKMNSFSAIAVLGDGKILVGGDFTINGKRKILIKLMPNGALDNSYVFSDYINSPGSSLPTIREIIDLGADRVLIVGNFNVYTLNNNLRTDYNHLIKLTYDGKLDISFRANLLSSSFLTEAILLKDEKLLIAGDLVWGNGSTARKYIAKLNTNGTQDLSLNFKEKLGGIYQWLDGSITAMALQSDGKIIIGGDFTNIENTTVRDGVYDYNQIARLAADGSTDLTFKTSEGYRSDIKDLIVLTDDRILAGRGFSLVAGTGDTYLKLYSKDGVIDDSSILGYKDSTIEAILKQGNSSYFLIGSFTDSSSSGVLAVTIK